MAEPWERLVRAIEESGQDQLAPLAGTNLPEIPNGAPTVTLMRADLVRFRANHAQMLGALAVYLDCDPGEVNLFRLIQGIWAKKYPEMDLRGPPLAHDDETA